MALLLVGFGAAYHTSGPPSSLGGGPLAQAVIDEASKARAAANEVSRTAQASADEVLGDFIRVSTPRDVDVARSMNHRFRHTGVPVVSSWKPLLERASPPNKATASIAQLTEQQQAAEATVTYLHPTMQSSFVRFGYHDQRPTLSLYRTANASSAVNGGDDPDRLRQLNVMREYSQGVTAGVPDAGWSEAEAAVRKTADDEWNANAKVDAQARGEEWIQRRASEEADREQAETEAKARGANALKKLKAEEKARASNRKTGIARCGFSWDDAAAKMGAWCSSDQPSTCEAPPGTTDNPKSYWFEQEYACFNDLPDIGVRVGGRKCRATPGSGGSTNAWCTEYCNTPGAYCDPKYCDCSDGGTGLQDSEAFKVPETFNVSAPIQPHDPNISAYELRNRTEAMVAAVVKQGEAQPSTPTPTPNPPPRVSLRLPLTRPLLLLPLAVLH